MDKQHCSGCRDDFYNDKNPYGVKECWLLKTAKLEPRLLIPISLAPPYRHIKARPLPTCYKADGYATVKPESIGPTGYWGK